MRCLQLVLFFMIGCAMITLPSTAQNNSAVNNISKPRVYAVVVGISSYENPGIPQLSFAHKDAQVFANYLSSKSGGSVPLDQIRMLLNEQATYAAIYDALNWLLENVKENDLVYFYFSGHGDMENNTIYKLGFLLSYNSPRNNYINSAVRIEDLNNIANTLSVKAKAKVILITDACHSGKLAGSDFRGNSLVGEQLVAMKKQEIRMTSCEPEQLSAEDVGWGGGRGVFSYYLIKGLQGRADKGHDGVVTVSEIKSYLDSVMSGDVLLAQKEMKQTPGITGNINFPIAFVDKQQDMQMPAPVVTLSSPSTQQTVLLKPLAKPAQAYLFDVFESQKIEEIYDFDSLNAFSEDEIPLAFLFQLPNNYKEFITAEKVNEIKISLQSNPEALKRFKNKLVVILSDRGQSVINQYIDGDEAELERRRYYNVYNSGYDEYPKMFAVALKLVQPGSNLENILKIKFYYFTAVAAILKIPTVKDPSGLIDSAMKYMQRAYALEENAAYIQNELGLLYNLKNDLIKAEKFYLRATQISPTWAIPWNNLAGIYLQKKEYEKSMEAVKKAIDLQPKYQGSYINLALLHERQNNLLLGEEYFRRSIKMNSRHYLPFERLAYEYMATTDYALADSFFYESDLRKKGFFFPKHMKFPKPMDESISVLPPFFCPVNKADVKDNDVLGNFALGMQAYMHNDSSTAEVQFRKTLMLDKENPLAWHYLGKVLYNQQRWQEAAVMFEKAKRNYADSASFDAYYKKFAEKSLSSPSNNCIRAVNFYANYRKIEDGYLLASVYERWNHFTEAEKMYREIISSDPSFAGGYQKLWGLFESMGRYADAEAVLNQFSFNDHSTAAKEMNAFYARWVDKFPADKNVYYKAGNFLYNMVAANPTRFGMDLKDILPDTDSAAFRNVAPRFEEESYISLPGTNERLTLAPAVLHPITKGVYYLQHADSLFDDDNDALLAEINQKTGDLLNWQGLAETSIPYYKKSVRLDPANANTRMKLVKANAFVYFLSDAMEQLDSLKQRKQLNVGMQLLLAKYYMLSSKFGDADSLLKTAMTILPYNLPEILELQGRLQLLKKNAAEAISFYRKFNELEPNNPAVQYSIARLYAQANKNHDALQWLRRSIASGFNYSWVLDADDSWNEYRNKADWKTISKTMVAKTYAE